jgi:hypothetical protein
VTEQDPATRPSRPGKNLLGGAVFGLGAGLAAGALWFLVVVGTTTMTTYLVPAIGFGVAYGVYMGAHRPGRRAAVVAVLITVVATAFALYYVERYLVISWFSEHHDTKHIPLVPYLDWMRVVIGHAFGKGPAVLIYSVLAVAVAGWFGLRGFHGLHHQDAKGAEHQGRSD